jgi:hypothetical protein
VLNNSFEVAIGFELDFAFRNDLEGGFCISLGAKFGAAL